MINRYSKSKAFTLVEILLALAILGVGLVSILSLFTIGTHSARRALNVTRASLLAQLTLEELKLLSITNYDGITDGTDVDSYSAALSEYTDFSLALDVTDNPLGAGIPNLKKVELTVSWNNGNSSEVFVTYVAKYSP